MTLYRKWQQRLYFFALVAVLFTTLFSWFNVNSLCIMLLVVSRFMYQPLKGLKTAFGNKIFLGVLAYCVIGAVGFFYTHNVVNQAKTVSREATLVAVALVWAAGEWPGGRSYQKLLTWYYFLIVAASGYCLVVACRNYGLTGDFSVFFYHALTRPISQNAVFYSVYVVFALLFVLSPTGEPLIQGLSARGGKFVRAVLVVFFLGMIVLLSSKLVLVIALLLVIHALLRRYSFRQHKWIIAGAGACLATGIILLAVTDNPISKRYRDMKGDLALVKKKDFLPDQYFNPLQLRLLEWRFGGAILREHNAWLFGVTPGDSQDLLDTTYVHMHMWVGNPNDGPTRHIRGFLGYNFHNQYLETTVRSGFLGLAALLFIFAALFAAARREGIREPWFVILIIAVFFVPEAPLTLQHGVFLFCFFPLMALSGPGRRQSAQRL
jgi:O-antigen ligase